MNDTVNTNFRERGFIIKGAYPYRNFKLFRIILEQNLHNSVFVNSVLISEQGDY